MSSFGLIRSEVYGGLAPPPAAAHQRVIPTVFVALGGTGKDVLMRLRKRFFDRDVQSAPGYTRFLFIDTDPGAFKPEEMNTEDFAEVLPRPEEQISCVINTARFEEVFQWVANGVHNEQFLWLKPGMKGLGPKAVQKGAGKHRQFGRLGFVLYADEIRDKLERAIQDVLRYAGNNPQEVETECIEVVLVTSLAGGTGAGMFLDAAYLVKTLLKPRTTLQQYVTLVAFLPTLWKDKAPALYPWFQQNGYAALLEMEYYSTPRTGDELFLGEQIGGRNEQVRSLFHAPWNPREPLLEGPAWGDCYLIDDVNDLDPNRPLDGDKVFQMVADFLFLDFEQHEFATRKRSARSNLEQIKHQWCANWVTTGQKRQALDEPGETVYVTHNGCAYSSFGLAEIFFDLDRLYKAASYRLAWRLVQSRWLGEGRTFREEDYAGWVQADLMASPSFDRDALIRRLLTGPDGCVLDRLDADLAALRTTPPAEGFAEVKRTFRDHRAKLAERGQVDTMIRENLKELKGTPHELGPLRSRLRALVLEQLSRHGLAAALHLLTCYRARLQAVDATLLAPTESLNVAFEAADRLDEAGSIGLGRLVRGTAQAIEFPRACDALSTALHEQYDQAAARAAQPPSDNPQGETALIVLLNQYLGAEKETPPLGLSKHGTLHELCGTVGKYLAEVSAQLDSRFKQFANPDDRHAPRRQPLATGWSETVYDARIDEALVQYPPVGPATTKGGRVAFDWPNLERLVVARLAEIETEDVAGLNQAADLFEYWTKARTNPEDKRTIVESIAVACRDILRGDGRHGGLNLDDVRKGNAVDLLAGMHEGERKALIDQMVKASAPFLPIRGHRNIGELRLSYSNLYGRNTGARSNDESIRELVGQELRRLDPGMPSESLTTLTAVDSSLVLVREVAGFPLQYYTRLNTLRDAYKETHTYTKHTNECHIDYRLAMRDLPDICVLDTPTYARIREHVSTVLRGIIIGAITWEDGEFRVKVPNIFAGARAFGLGTKFDRMIKYVCDSEDVLNYLVRRWKEWSNAATTADRACLFAAALQTYRLIEGRVTHLDETHEEPPPLRNCYHQLVIQTREDLDRSEQGPQWSAALLPHGGAATGNNGAYLSRVVDQVLRRVRDDLPVYQILADKVKGLDPPFASVAVPS